MGAFCPTETAQNIGKYTLIEKIGEGYLGPVYRGFDQDLGNPVVVRILCDGIKWDPKLEENFNRESRAVSDLQHPNIAKVLEVGGEGQTRYIVMESLGSGTLENMIARNSAVPVETKISIMIAVAEGLGHAHKNGVLHRDLGPGKIHLTPDGSVKIRDFAIAHVLMKYLPHPAVRFGTPIYLCPEQIQQKDCDERSDIFSAGTIFYELLNHLHPFHDRDSNKALDNILSDSQIPTFEKFPEAPPGIWPILRSCLAKNPSERYSNTDELSSACKELQKSLAEDKQVMLAELYAALTPLKIAAAQPNATEKTIALLQDIQRLLRGEKQADFGHLDQLMTVLLEEYPTIQAVADKLPPAGPVPPDFTAEPEFMGKAYSGFSLPLTIVGQEAPAPAAEQIVQHSDETGNCGTVCECETAPESAHVPEPVAGNSEGAAAPPVPEKKADLAEYLAEPIQPGEIERHDSVPVFSQESLEEPTAAVPDPGTERRTDSEKQDSALSLLQPAVNPVTTHPASTDFRTSKGRFSKNSYRSAVVLLSLLVLATAGYIALGPNAIQKAWGTYMPKTGRILRSLVPGAQAKSTENSVPAEPQGSQEKSEPNEILLREAKAAANSGRVEQCRVLLNRILENDPSNQAALAYLRQIESAFPTGNRATEGERSLDQSVTRISGLINSGKLQSAKSEIDRLQQSYPGAPQVSGLLRRWQALNSKQTMEQTRKEEELQRMREDEWGRQISDLLGRGKYSDAAGSMTLWLSENPGSQRAAELNNKIQEIQRHLKAYSQAMNESRYPDAYNALSSAEKINPADAGLGELRRQIDSRKAAARATLTVRRLGPKAVILLDGRPIGKEGEVENESIPIGSHTLAVENGGGVVTSKTLDYAEGQRVSFVYDLLKQNLRPMAESDREGLARRKATEEAARFSLEHDHGLFRGSCQGTLSLDPLDIAYSPSSGSHGFRIPFKLLKITVQGKTVSMDYISDNSHFQTFKFQDAQAAQKFSQKWDEIKALIK